MPKLDLQNNNPYKTTVVHNYPIEKIHEKQGVRYECWGESKTLKEWAADPRSVVKKWRTIEMRVNTLGWSMEKTLTTNVMAMRREAAKQRVTPRIKENVISAWGESKTIFEWAKLEICQVSRVTLWRRIKSGWLPEEAISAPPYRVPVGYIEGLKEKTLGEIVREAAAIKRKMAEMNLDKIEEKLEEDKRKKLSVKVVMTITKVDEENIYGIVKSRFGVGDITISRDPFPVSYEGDDYRMEVTRTMRRRGKKGKESLKTENQKILENIVKEKEKRYTTKDDNLSKFEE